VSWAAAWFPRSKPPLAPHPNGMSPSGDSGSRAFGANFGVNDRQEDLAEVVIQMIQGHVVDVVFLHGELVR